MKSSVVIALIVMSVLSGCVSETTSAAKPYDLVAAQKNAAVQFPTAKSFALLNNRGDGFRIYNNGSAEYLPFNATSEIVVETSIAKFQGNEICLAPADGWSGACLKFFDIGNDNVNVQVKFGNNAVKSYETRFIPEV